MVPFPNKKGDNIDGSPDLSQETAEEVCVAEVAADLRKRDQRRYRSSEGRWRRQHRRAEMHSNLVLADLDDDGTAVESATDLR